MKREAVQKHLSIINAFAAGEEIEYYDGDFKHEWLSCGDDPVFDINRKYRIKCNKNYEPFTFDSIQHYLDDWVVKKGFKVMMKLHYIDKNYVIFYTHQGETKVTYEQFLNEYMFLNNEPCGVKIKK